MIVDVRLNAKVGDFNLAMNQMQAKLRSSGITMQQIIDFEVGRILEKALSGTKAATKASISASIEKRPPWRTYDLGRGQKKYKLTNHYPDPIWALIEARLAASLKAKLNARGYAKQTWWELAQVLGVKIAAPGYVQAASVAGHTNRENVGAERMNSDGKYTLYIENTSPLLRFTDAKQAFFSAVAGRVKYIQRNLALGVFNDLSQVAKRFPGLVVTVAPL